MVPNVFVSSTVADLHFLRDAIRDVIKDLGYTPILSDYGDIGYMSSVPVQDACLQAMKECNLAVLIIGKRYGNIATNGVSVTHSEFLAARDKNIPVLCLVDEEVLTFKKVYDGNSKTNPNSYPGMDDPHKTFDLIDQFVNSRVNNGYRSFKTVNDARETVVKQFALFFGELLREKRDPINSDIKDVLAAVQTLQHRLADNNREPYLKFQHTTRLLIDNFYKALFEFVTKLFSNFDEAISQIITAATLEELVENAGWKVVTDTVPDFMRIKYIATGYSSIAESVPPKIRAAYPEQIISFGMNETTKIVEANELTWAYLRYLFAGIKEKAEK